jgi:hypothetical protein
MQYYREREKREGDTGIRFPKKKRYHYLCFMYYIPIIHAIDVLCATYPKQQNRTSQLRESPEGTERKKPAGGKPKDQQVKIENRYPGSWLSIPSTCYRGCLPLLETELSLSSRGRMTLGVGKFFLIYFSHSTTMSCPPMDWGYILIGC